MSDLESAALYRESFETIAAVVSWMDEQEEQGREFPSKMKGRLIKAAGVVRDELDEPPDVGINGEGTEVLYDESAAVEQCLICGTDLSYSVVALARGYCEVCKPDECPECGCVNIKQRKVPYPAYPEDRDFVLDTGGLPSDEELTDLIRRSVYESEAQQRMAPPMPWEKDDE